MFHSGDGLCSGIPRKGQVFPNLVFKPDILLIQPGQMVEQDHDKHRRCLDESNHPDIGV